MTSLWDENIKYGAQNESAENNIPNLSTKQKQNTQRLFPALVYICLVYYELKIVIKLKTESTSLLVTLVEPCIKQTVDYEQSLISSQG